LFTIFIVGIATDVFALGFGIDAEIVALGSTWGASLYVSYFGRVYFQTLPATLAKNNILFFGG
jgi:hypothetical protein